MAIIIIGGHSRSVGKTSVVAGLIAALPEYNWTAFKITQYGHGVCSANGEPCHCATDDHSWAISEEQDRSGKSDTSRFLAAGAVRAWWARCASQAGRMPEFDPRIEQHSQIRAPGSLPYRPRSRHGGLQEISSGIHGSSRRRHPAPEPGAGASMARHLHETRGREASIPHFSAGICHATNR